MRRIRPIEVLAGRSYLLTVVRACRLEPEPNLPPSSGHSLSHDQIRALDNLHVHGCRPAGGAVFLPGSSPYAVPSRRRRARTLARRRHSQKTPAAAGAARRRGAPKLPPRTPFTAADDAAAVIPGMPDARFLGRFGSRLHQGAAVAAGPVAHSLDRRRGRRIRRRPAQRLERRRQAAGLCGRHRREHRRADGAVCLCRPEIRRRAQGRLHQDHGGGHFRGRRHRRELSSIPGR